MRFQRVSALCGMALVIGSLPAYSETYAYLSEGDTGEPVFSDIPSASAQRIPLPEYDQPPSLSSAEQIEQMLIVAEELAIAREAREANRADRRAAARDALPPVETIYIEERHAYGYPYYPYPYPHPPAQPDPVPPSRPTKSIRFEPK